MIANKQVSHEHYRFSAYMHKKRWASYWHQLDEVIRFDPRQVLEIGPGPGLFKTMAAAFGVEVHTLDIDPDLKPDHVASVFEMPFANNAYDVVCAFQMLEHLPYEDALRAFGEMARVASRGIVISLPDSKGAWPFILGLPQGREIARPLPSPRFWALPNVFNGEHYWELNKQGFALKRVAHDLSQFGFTIANTYRVDRYPYHRFFVFHPE